MGSEAFYTTAAQVLPTLLIALAVEAGFMMQAAQRSARKWEKKGDEAQAEEGRLQFTFWVRTATGVGVVFLVGEVWAFLAIGFRWFNVWSFTGIGICLLLMILAVVLVPLFRHTSPLE
ncbi:hypothetical protein [Nonomuraea sp. SYSU D8015]|uniref:hypothetical protein n=1 Tax=Nonomuraea sp. SYSU D8015 TaxID=2593644 RepID=UPI001660A6FC|nr:hypothetical protein [Nonomuraea sp. SYSU D8015]